ncbi:RNA-directed DNA polymerase from mobile element jockey-like [Elysia marginata]|uniref:RNA-directed DNA polymerase from mobile element jockey-like n=1 Tax=Elysia marginata TaxID=1093978 RepID=A0AAV4J8S2_9GAST|nr:RNA-directed DNA polymerase from mobile element jockey-like [Elysia marginata]
MLYYQPRLCLEQIVVCKVHAKLKALKKPKHQMKYNLKALNKDPDLRNKFTVDVKNKFEALEASTAEERQWEILKDSIEKTAEKNIPKQPKREHKKWMTQSILDKMALRRKAKQDPSSKKRTAQGGCIKSKDGKILVETSDILERWSEYIQELFCDERGQQSETQKPIEGPPILKAEVEKTINDMKNGKAAGPDQIRIELLQALGNWGMDQLTKLLNRTYDTGNILKDMLISTFITLQKKTGSYRM